MTLNLRGLLSQFLRKKSDSSSVSRDILHTSTAEPYIRMLVDDISKAHQTIDIVESEDNIYVYEDERVKNALSNAFDRGIVVRMVLTPSVSERGI